MSKVEGKEYQNWLERMCQVSRMKRLNRGVLCSYPFEPRKIARSFASGWGHSPTRSYNRRESCRVAGCWC